MGDARTFADKPKDMLLKKVDHREVAIKFNMFTYQRDYGYEYLGNC